MKLTEEQREFLSALARYTATVTRRDLSLADRRADKARQSCRRNQWAEFGRWEGDRKIGWRITDAGRRALAEQEGK